MKSFYYFLVGISLLAFGFSGVATSIDAHLGLVYSENPSPRKQEKPQPKKYKEAKGNAKITHFSLLTGEITTTDALALIPTITATKTVAVQGGGNPIPGSQLNYTVVINNTASGVANNATDVTFTDVLVNDLTLVGGSVKATPIGVNDAYDVIGNVGITVPAGSGVLTNDVSPDGTAITATLTTASANGTLTLSSNGAFTYTPNVGFSGTDSFVYTVVSTNGTTSTNNTVTLTVSAPIWFVNIAATTSTNAGTLANPFKDWSDFATSNTFSGATNPAVNQTIFVYSGTYSGKATLKTGQKVLGQGATTTLASFAGVTPTFSNTLPTTSGTNPNLTSSGGTTITIPTTSTITLRGFDMGNSTTDIASGASFGTLTTSEMALNGNGQALDLASGALSASFTSISSTNSAAQGIRLLSVSGTLTSTGGTTITNSTSDGIGVYSASSVNANFGNTNVTGSGGAGLFVSGSNSNTAALTFGDLDIAPDAAQNAINYFGRGSLTCTSGTITTSNTPGTTAGIGIAGGSAAQKVTLSMVLNSFSITGNAGTLIGLDIQNTLGSFAINGTGTTAGSGGTISTIQNRGVQVITATNITLKNMNFTNANTVGGTAFSTTDISGSNAAIYCNGVNGVTLDNIQMNTTTGNVNAQNGITLFNVTAFNLANSTITRCGTGNEEACIMAVNTSGTCTISNSTISKASRCARFTNNSTNMTLKVTGSSFNDTRTFIDPVTPTPDAQLNPDGGSGILFEGYGSSVMSLDVKSACNFLRIATGGVEALATDNAVVSADVQNSTFNATNANLSTGEDVGIGVRAQSGVSATVKFNFLNNTITGRGGDLINVGATNAGRMEGTIDGNTIIYNFKSAINNNAGNGIGVVHASTNTTSRVKINNNTITNIAGSAGISANVSGGSNGRADIICTNNNVTLITSLYGTLTVSPVNYGFIIGSVGTSTICSKVANNTSNAGALGIARIRAAAAGDIHLVEGSGLGSDNINNLETIWNNLRTTGTTASAGQIVKSGVGTHTLSAVGTCASPSNPLINLSVPSPVLVENLPKELPTESINQTEAVDTLAEEEISTEAKSSTESTNSGAKIAAPLSGETVTINGAGSGFSLPAGKSTTVTFSATVSSTPSTCAITNQASVSGSNFTTVNSNTTTTSLIVPPPTGVTGATSVCSGLPISLSATCPSGTAQWYTTAAPSTLLGTGSPFSQSPTANTTYTAKCKVGGCESVGTNSGLITVNALPVPAPGSNSPVCTGATLSLTSAVSTTYFWSGPNSFTSSLQNPNISNVSIVAGGTYTVRQTNSFGCTALATVIATVNALPNATASTSTPSVCVGGTINLSSSGGGTYLWNGPSTFTSSQQNPSITNATTGATGTYVVRVTNNGCTATNNVVVTVNTNPTASPSSNTPVCLGSTLNLFSSVANSYLWTGPNGFSATIQNPSISNVSVLASAPYTLRVTNTNGCTATATTVVVFNITQAPTEPKATPSSRTTAGSSTLSVTLGCAVGGTLTWFNAATNVAVPSPNNQPSFTSSGTFNFYAKCTGANTCVSDASANVPVTVTLCTPLASSPGPVDITWTGLESTDWNTACNWSPAWVPDVTNGNVIIGNATNKPIITTGNVATVKAIKINSNGTLIVNSGGTLNIRGNGVEDNGIEINDNAFMTNNGTVKIESATQTAILASIYLRGTVNGAYLFNNGTIVVNSTDTGIGVGSSPGSYVTNNPTGIITIENGTGIGVSLATDILEFSNNGIINYNGAGLAMSLQGNTTFAGSGTFNINSGTGISNTSPAIIEINPCGKILMASGTFVNTGTTTNNGLLQMPNAYDFTNTGTFTNGGVLKANTVSGITNNQMVITNACPIFTLAVGGSTYTVSGIFTDAAATTSAGTYTSVGNKFTANNTIPTGTQTLYAKVTNESCTFIVPFDFNNVKPTAVSVDNTTICPNGSVILSATCASGTITWYTTATGGTSIGTGTSLSQSPTVATTYYAACEATNCVSGRVATNAVTVSSLPSASASSNSPICAGATLNLTGGAAGNTYSWTGPNSFTSMAQSPTIASVTSLATGTYTITVTNANNCTATSTTAVTVNAVPTATASSNSPVCTGNSISLTGGGVGTYLWSGPNSFTSTAQSPTIASATVSATGTYTITVTNANSCTSTATVAVTVNANPTATASSSTPVICAGNSISLTGGGVGTYSWTGVNGFTSTDQNPSIPNATVLASGTYKITVTNVSGCTSTSMTSITVNANPTATASSSTPVICAGNSISLTGGGVGTYAWAGPNGYSSTAQSPTISNATVLATGTYTITVTNTSNCSSTASVAVTVNALPTATASSNSPVCVGTTLNLTSGGGFSYSWSGPLSNLYASTLQNPSISNARLTDGGTYTVTVMNVNGCQSTATTSVTVNAIPTATASSSTPVICAGNNISLTGGGIGTYAWSGPNGYSSTAQSPTISNATVLATGTYTITVTNTSNCSSTATVAVIVNSLPTATASSNTPSICVGNTLSLTGGGIGTYAWTGVNGFTSTDQNPSIPNATLLASGTYKITVTNINGCTSTAMTSITVNANPTATASSSTPVICAGNSISLTGGGVGTYSWTGVNGFTSTDQNPSIPNASILASGTYKITVTNINGCTSTATTSITVNANPTATASSNAPVCAGTTLSLTGGGVGTYLWAGPNGYTSTAQSPSISSSTVLASGVYKITVTNVNSCTSTATTSVTVNPLPVVDAGANQTICEGSTASLTAICNLIMVNTTLSGASEVPANASTATGTVSGTYDKVSKQLLLTFTFNGLAGNASAAHLHKGAVGVNGPVQIGFSGVPSATSGSFTYIGTLTTTQETDLLAGLYYANIHNATFPGGEIRGQISTACVANNFVWNPGNLSGQTVTVSPIAAQLYTVTASNTATGCSTTATTKVNVNPRPVPTIGSNTPVCAGNTLTLNAGGGTSYAWSGPNAFTATGANPSIASVTLLATGTYTVTVTSSSNCTNSATTVVVINALPTATASNNSPICSGVTLNLIGGGIGSYLWTGPSTFTSTAQSPNIPSATASMSGTYTITVTNANGCTSTATTSVTVNPVVTTPTPQANTQIIFGGSVTITAMGCSGVNDVLKWYKSSDNTLAVMPVSPTATTNYYAKCETTLNGITCISGNSTDVTVTVLSPNPPVATGATNCLGTPTTLTATGCSGSVGTFVLKWYQNADDVLVTMPVSPLVSTDYYAKCEQTFNSVTAVSTKSNVVTLTILNPPTPVSTGGTIYNGQSISLTATGCSGTLGTFTLKWYQTSDNASVTMPVSPTVTTQYYAKCEQTANAVTCLSAKSNDVTVTVVNRIFVDITKIAAPIQNGNSWATAYGNLQTGLAAATAGVEVWVAKGTYKPTNTVTRTIYFNVPTNVIVYGGFAGTEDNLVDRNFSTNVSILSGDIGTQNLASDNSYHVAVFDASSNTTVLDGFTIKGGNANFDPKYNASPFTNNLAASGATIETGGGILVLNAGKPIIRNCIVTNNNAWFGAGIFCVDGSTPSIFQCNISNNESTFGAAIYAQNASNFTMNSVLMAGNKGVGSVYNNTSNPTLTNCTIASNGGYNGGIFNSASQPVIKNSILWGNTQPFNDTQSIITYSTVQGGYPGVGNLNYDPQLVNPAASGPAPNTTGDYHLKAASLTIDRGDNGSISLTDKDLDGNLRRFAGGRVDMGAYEFQGTATSAIVISFQTGNWESNSTWDIGRVPQLGDYVIINNNHIVTLSGIGIAKNLEYRGTGKLNLNTTASKLNIGF